MSQAPDPRRGERGHLMAGVMVLVAMLGIMSAVAVQDYSQVLRRDNEAEMMFRAQEITRAIQRYRKDHGGQSPTELELLMEPGAKGQYYMRRLYEDPLAKDGKWGLLFLGPGNTIIDPNAEGVDPLTGLPTGGGAGGGGLGGGLNGLGQSQAQNNGQGGNIGNQSGGNAGNNNQGSSKQPSTFRPSSFANSGGAGQGNGLPIAGVRTLSDEDPFREYNGLTAYNEWQFTYLDLEQAQIPGQGRRRPGAGGLNRGGGNNRGGLGGNQRGGLGGNQRGGLTNSGGNNQNQSGGNRR